MASISDFSLELDKIVYASPETVIAELWEVTPPVPPAFNYTPVGSALASDSVSSEGMTQAQFFTFSLAYSMNPSKVYGVIVKAPAAIQGSAFIIRNYITTNPITGWCIGMRENSTVDSGANWSGDESDVRDKKINIYSGGSIVGSIPATSTYLNSLIFGSNWRLFIFPNVGPSQVTTPSPADTATNIKKSLTQLTWVDPDA